RGVPRRGSGPAALTVVVADAREDRGGLSAVRPVETGRAAHVLLDVERAVVEAAREDVVLVGRVADAVDHVAVLGERGLLGDVVGRGVVQLVDVRGDHDALGVVPWTPADAVAGVDGRARPAR